MQIELNADGLPVDPKSLEGREFVHFKGNRYRLEAFATDSETLAPMVVYRPLYGESKLWVRPAKMFFEHVDRPDYHGPRFRLCSFLLAALTMLTAWAVDVEAGRDVFTVSAGRPLTCGTVRPVEARRGPDWVPMTMRIERGDALGGRGTDHPSQATMLYELVRRSDCAAQFRIAHRTLFRYNTYLI